MLTDMPVTRLKSNPYRFIPMPSTDGEPDVRIRALSREDLEEVKAKAERDAARRGQTIVWQKAKAISDGGLEARGVTRAIAPS